MKKKALFSIVAIALFAVTMAFNSQKDETKNLTVKNQEALANPASFGVPYAAACANPGACFVPGAEEYDWETSWVIIYL
jgi:hypothetical protein